MSKKLASCIVATLATCVWLTTPAKAADCNTNGTDDALDVPITSVLSSSNTPLLIPDNTPGGLTDIISDPNSLTVLDLNVRVNIQHTFDSDIILRLSHAGAVATLLQRNNGSGDNYTNTLFDDAAATSITAAGTVGPFTSTFRPVSLLSVFNGQNENGNWSLFVSDNFNADTGTLVSWSLNILVQTGTPGVGDCNTNGTPDSCDAGDCNTDLTPDVCQLVGKDCNTNGILDVCELAGNDCNTNGTIDRCEPANATSKQTSSTNATSLLIPDNQGGAGAVSAINVATFGLVADVNVQLSVQHTLDSNLRMALVHNASTVTIYGGSPGAGQNFTGTVFDDSAAVAITATANTAPFSGTFRPSSVLTTFNNQQKHGIWQLRVTDAVNTNTGTLLSWSLFLQTSVATDCNTNGTLDACDIAFGGFQDSNNDSILDICQDCDTNGSPDPDQGGADCNTNAIPDICEVDCNTNGIADACELAATATNSFAATGVPALIPENNTNGLNSVIAVAGAGTVTDVNVQLSIQHPLNSNLRPMLIHAATTVTLYAGTPAGANFTNTVFDQQASFSITAGLAPFSNTFTPPTNTLNSFNGHALAGNWTLRVSDVVNLNTGTLLSWSLFLQNGTGRDCNTNGILDNCESPDCNTNNTLDICEIAGNDCNTNGTVDQCDIGFGGQPDCDTNGRPDQCDLLLQVVAAPITATDTPFGLPDAVQAGVNSVITSAASGTISDVNISVFIKHSFDSDIDMFLSHGATTVEITTDNGGFLSSTTGGGFNNTLFDDSAAIAITSTAGAPAVNPFTGTFRPEGLLSSFNGQVASGTWTLNVADDEAIGTGTLHSWTLFLATSKNNDCNTNGIPDACDVDADHDGTPDACQDCNTNGTNDSIEPAFADCNTNSIADFCDIGIGMFADCNTDSTLDICQMVDCNTNGTLDLCDIRFNGVPDCNTNGTPDSCALVDCNTNGLLDLCDVAFGTASDCNTDGTPDSCQLSPVQPPVVIASTDVPKPIPDNAPAGTVSALTVTGLGSVVDVNVKLTITHTWDSDLDVALTKGGTTAFLISINGGSGDNFNGTVFDDEASVSINSGVAPFAGTFIPLQPLSAFDGQPKAGTWRLFAADFATGDVGTITAWQIILTATSNNDCNTNGTPDQCDLDANSNGVPDACEDCNANGTPDSNEPFYLDCNTNDTADFCEISGGTSGADCNTDHTLDICQFGDCNTNNTLDLCEGLVDCDANNTPDICEFIDCNTNGTLDACDLAGHDCNTNGVPDICDLSGEAYLQSVIPTDTGVGPGLTLAGGSSLPHTNEIADNFKIIGGATLTGVKWQSLSFGAAADCPGPDSVTIRFYASTAGAPGALLATYPNVAHTKALSARAPIFGTNPVYDNVASLTPAFVASPGTEFWLSIQGDYTPGGCAGVYGWVASDERPPGDLTIFQRTTLAGPFGFDDYDVAFSLIRAGDCDTNGTPDECEPDLNMNGIADPCEDCNTNGTLDPSEPGYTDCNGNDVLDACEIATGSSADCNTDGTLDSCQMVDCNTNGQLDICDIGLGAADCNTNGVPDLCELVDCNTNGILDRCDVLGGAPDCNADGVPDVCQLGGTSDVSFTPNASIADGVTTTQNVSLPPGTVTDVDVRLSIQHTFDGDLDITLFHGGLTVTLTDDNGGSGDNYTGTVFDQSAATAVTAGVAPFTGTFRPETSLNLFNGTQRAGVWSLRVFDDAGGDTGTLLSWGLLVRVSESDCNTNGTPDSCDTPDCNSNHTPDVCEPLVDCNSNGTVDICENRDCNTNGSLDDCEALANCNTNGTPDICEAGFSDCNTNLTADFCEVPDCNTNGRPDVCDLIVSVQMTENSTDVPLAIPDNDPSGVFSNLIAAGPGVVTDVNVKLTITHSWDSDLDIALINGATTAFLASVNGGSGDNFLGTVFDDEAGASINSGTAPFTGTFIPLQSLSAFDGLNKAGTWTLFAADFAGGDTGSIVSWSLAFTLNVSTDSNGNGTPDVCESACATCTGDINGDGNVDGQDIAGWVRCSFGTPLVGDNCACSSGMTTAQFINKLLTDPNTACP